MRRIRSEQDNDLDQSMKVWEDVSAETGYVSYYEYLKTSAQRHLFFPHYEPTYCPPSSSSQRYMCSIIDLLRDEKSNLSMSSQDYYSEARLGATEMLGNLRHPSQTACLRVLLWWSYDNYGEPRDLFEVCGLGLKIHPRFFEALIDRANKNSLDDRYKRGLVQPSLPDDLFRSNYTVVGNHILTIARDYISGRADIPPILLIVGWSDGRDDCAWGDHSGNEFDPDTPHSYKCEPDEVSHFQASVVESGRSRFLRSRTYVRILDQLLKRSDSAATGNEHLLILSTLPLMHLDTLHMRANMRSLRRAHIRDIENAEVANTVKRERNMLRRHIEDSETSSKNFATYAHSHEGGDLLRRQDFMIIEELWRNTLSQARLLETEVRDNLQLQASQLSLQESRKSIELSNQQIEENRRGSYFPLPGTRTC